MYFNLEIEIFKEKKKKLVFLAHDGSSGCKYEYKNKKELKEIIKDYVDDIVDYEIK